MMRTVGAALLLAVAAASVAAQGRASVTAASLESSDGGLESDGGSALSLDASAKYPIWQELNPSMTPTVGSLASLAFDTTRGVAVLLTDATYEWNGTHWTAVCTSTQCQATAPSDVEIVYDVARGVTVAFAATGPVEWDGTTWTAQCTDAPCNTNMPVQPTWLHTIPSADAASSST
jgi:hypothetical protein